MTIQEALAKLRAVAPDKAIHISVDVWSWAPSQYRKDYETEVSYAVWCDSKRHEATSLEVAVELILDSMRTASVSEAETRLEEARELVKQPVTCPECSELLYDSKPGELVCAKCGYVLAVPQPA